MPPQTTDIASRFIQITALLLVTAAVAGPGDEIIDTVNVEVDARDSVDGTLRPAEERETFLLTLPRGASLKISAKSTSSGAPTPELDVLDPDRDVITASPAAKPVKAPKVTIAKSGPHSVRVCGDGELDGDYNLKLRAKMPKSWSARAAADLAADAEDTFAFGAAGGATATITLTLSGRSSFAPELLELTGPDEFVLALGPAPQSSRKHVVKNVVLPATGEYVVRFRNAGTGAGQWRVKIKLKTPNAPKRTIALTDDVLAGDFAGEQVVYARSVGAEGGTVDVPDGTGLLSSVSMSVPPGAVTDPALFQISISEPFFVDDDTSEGGETFELGPSGTEFAVPVDVTIPFDPQSYDPGDAVTVAVRDGDTGDVEILTGTVDVDAGEVTFQTSHFSRFQPASPRPRPLVGGFVELEFSASLSGLRAGSVRLGLNEVRGATGLRTGNAFTRDLDRREVTFSPGLGGNAVIFGGRDRSAQVGIVSAAQNLELRVGQATRTYERGRSPDILVRADVSNGRALASVLLRRVKGKPTRGALQGDWSGVVVEFSAARGTAGGVELASTGQTFDIAVDRDGRVTTKKALRTTVSTPYPVGEPRTTRDSRRPKSGSLVPDGVFARLDMDIGHRTALSSVDLHPVVRGDALVGVAGTVVGAPGDPSLVLSRLVILSRQTKDGADSDLMGRSRFVGYDLELLPSGQTGQPVDLRLDLLGLNVIHNGSGMLRGVGTGTSVVRGDGPTPQEPMRNLDFNSRYSVQKSLQYSEDAPYDRGMLLPRRGLYISTFFGENRIAIGFGLPARPLDE